MNNIPTLHMRDLSAESALQALKEFGVLVIPDFQENSAKIKQDCLTAISLSQRTDYKFGDLAIPLCRRPLSSIKESYPFLHDFFSASIFRNVFELMSLNEDGFCTDIFVTREFRRDQGVNRNGELHFDRIWALKFMLYLEDVDTDSGPFTIAPGSHKEGKKLRVEGWENSDSYGSIPNRLEQDFEDYPIPDLVPVTGRAGTLIMFDSDAFHKGGLVEPGKERFLVRAHCYDGNPSTAM